MPAAVLDLTDHQLWGPGKIIRGRTTPLPAIFSKGLRELVDSMLMVTPARRPNINEILRTPIMKSRIEKFLSNTVR